MCSIKRVKKMKEFKSVSGIVKNSLPANADSPVAAHLQQSFCDYWREHIGIAAPHTYPLLFQSGRLVVFCDSAVWCTQLHHQEPSLLRQLKDSNFKVSSIKAKIRPNALFLPPTKSAKQVEPMSAGNAKAMRELAEKIGHDGLRKSLLQLSERARKENKSG